MKLKDSDGEGERSEVKDDQITIGERISVHLESNDIQ